MEEKNSNEDQPPTEFERAGKEDELSLIREFLYFLREDKKWWMLPIVIALGAIGLLVTLSSTGAAPFIYTLF